MASTLGTLQVYLTADTKAFNKAIKNAKRDIAAFKSAIGTMAVGGAAALTAFAYKSVQAFQGQEDAVNALTASLAKTETDVASFVADFSKFASEMQSMTLFGDEATLQVMAYGKNLGIATDQMKEATIAAAGLSAKYGIDLNAAMMLIGRASQGQTTMLKRYGIVLKEGATDQEKFNELLRIGAGSFDLAKAQAQTTSGQITQMKNAFGDLQEVVGEMVVKNLGLLDGLKNLKSFIESFNANLSGMDESTKGLIARVSALTIGAIGLSTAFRMLKIQSITNGFIALAVQLPTVKAAMVAVNTSVIQTVASIGNMSVASLGAFGAMGTAVAAVGVAFAGWEIGKKIAEVTGLDKALEDMYGTWFFNLDEAMERSKDLDEQIARSRRTPKIEAQETAAQNVPDQKEIDAIASERKKLDDMIYERKFEQAKLDEKLIMLEKKRDETARKYLETESEVERIKLLQSGFKLKVDIEDLKKQIEEEANKIRDEGEIPVKAEVKHEFTQSKFANAVERGTVEAYRAELSAKNITQDYTKRTAENTLKMIAEQKKLNTILAPVAELGVA